MSDSPYYRIVHLTVIALAVGSLSLLSTPRAIAQNDGPETIQVPDTADAVVQIRGMVCSNCAQRMKRALEKLDGVTQASVQLEEDRAVLSLNGETEVSEKTLKERVNIAGYEFRGVVFGEKKKESSSSKSF